MCGQYKLSYVMASHGPSQPAKIEENLLIYSYYTILHRHCTEHPANIMIKINLSRQKLRFSIVIQIWSKGCDVLGVHPSGRKIRRLATTGNIIAKPLTCSQGAA